MSFGEISGVTGHSTFRMLLVAFVAQLLSFNSLVRIFSCPLSMHHLLVLLLVLLVLALVLALLLDDFKELLGIDESPILVRFGSGLTSTILLVTVYFYKMSSSS